MVENKIIIEYKTYKTYNKMCAQFTGRHFLSIGFIEKKVNYSLLRNE